jgi:hypothetical protein
MVSQQVTAVSDCDITLDSTTRPTSAVDYSEPFEKKRTQLIGDVVRVLDRHFPIEAEGEEPIVKFDRIGSDQDDRLYAAFNDFPEATLQLLAGVCGVPLVTVQREVGVGGFYDIADLDGLIHTNPRVRKTADYYCGQLPGSLPLSAVLQTVQYRWTVEYRRVYRQEFEQDLLSLLERQGIPVVSGSGFAGKPDVAIPDIGGDLAVVGEVRKMGRNEIHHRFDEFESEIESLNKKHPDASIVVVFDFFGDVGSGYYGDYVERLYENAPDSADIEGVYHFDESDQLVSDLKSVCPVFQSQLGDHQ